MAKPEDEINSGEGQTMEGRVLKAGPMHKLKRAVDVCRWFNTEPVPVTAPILAFGQPPVTQPAGVCCTYGCVCRARPIAGSGCANLDSRRYSTYTHGRLHIITIRFSKSNERTLTFVFS